MNKVALQGFKRKNLGSKTASRLRKEGYVPSVLYGGDQPLHSYIPVHKLLPLIHTSEVHFVDLSIDGKTYECIIQDVQEHPVSEIILHVDFLCINNKKAIKMHIPLVIEGNAPGVIAGGIMKKIMKRIIVKALPKHMPESIKVDVSNLDLGQAVRVENLKAGSYTFIAPGLTPIAKVVIPRALRTAE